MCVFFVLLTAFLALSPVGANPSYDLTRGDWTSLTKVGNSDGGIGGSFKATLISSQKLSVTVVPEAEGFNWVRPNGAPIAQNHVRVYVGGSSAEEQLPVTPIKLNILGWSSKPSLLEGSFANGEFRFELNLGDLELPLDWKRIYFDVVLVQMGPGLTFRMASLSGTDGAVRYGPNLVRGNFSYREEDIKQIPLLNNSQTELRGVLTSRNRLGQFSLQSVRGHQAIWLIPSTGNQSEFDKSLGKFVTVRGILSTGMMRIVDEATITSVGIRWLTQPIHIRDSEIGGSSLNLNPSIGTGLYNLATLSRVVGQVTDNFMGNVEFQASNGFGEFLGTSFINERGGLEFNVLERR